MNVIKGGHSGRALMFCQILYIYCSCPQQLAGIQLRKENGTFFFFTRRILSKEKTFVKNANDRYVIDNYDNLEFLINTRVEPVFFLNE